MTNQLLCRRATPADTRFLALKQETFQVSPTAKNHLKCMNQQVKMLKRIRPFWQTTTPVCLSPFANGYLNHLRPLLSIAMPCTDLASFQPPVKAKDPVRSCRRGERQQSAADGPTHKEILRQQPRH